MPSEKRKFGDIGEEAATTFLKKHGFKILDRNYGKPWGEIDIIAEKEGIIRFVEVKTSEFHYDPSFTPEKRVNSKKQEKLKRICETYLLEKELRETQLWQIDVVSVILSKEGGVHDIYHIENAVFGSVY